MSSITYAIILFFVLSLIGHGYYTIFKIKKHLHMLQLNGYFNRRYFGWLAGRKWRIFNVRELEPLVALIGKFFHGPLVVLLLFTIAYFRLSLTQPSLPEKKPLVFTARATRLFVVNLGLLLALYGGLLMIWWQKGDAWFEMAVGFLVVYNFFVPIILALTNLLLLPLERFIQYRYLRDAANYLSGLTNLKVIGITGSFGKTTTKYVVTEILRHKFTTLKTPGSYNTTMGVVKTIRTDLKPIHEVFVVEMSAKQPGDIQEICQLVHPQYGLITAIGEQHLETFGSLDRIKQTKNELIESLPTSGVAFFNLDDPNSRELSCLAKCRVVTYGIESSELDYRAVDLTLDGYGSTFKVVRTRDNATAVFRTELLGRHNIYNILGAVALASEVGVEFREMVYPVRQLAAVPHRLELKRVGGGIIFIDDAFNANPVGSHMALEVLAQISGKRKIIVTPGMIELGAKEEEYNQQFGREIADVCDYVILVGPKQTLALQGGLQAKQYPPQQLFIAVDFAAARKHLERILQAGDIVLFENDLPDNYSE